MQEKTIQKAAYITMFIGLSFLFIYTQEMELDPTSNLENIPATTVVKLQGIVSKVQQRNTTIFLEVEGTQAITTEVIAFPDREITVAEGNLVEITGVVEEYRGKKEVIAEQILVWEK